MPPTSRKPARTSKKPHRPLAGRVAVVAGATRGAGRGIAVALGEAGATVYCTGRSVAGAPSPYERPETIDDTAALVTAAGGLGIPVRVDHTVTAEIAALMARVKRDQRRLDVLVCTLGGEDPTLAWGKPFAELDADAMIETLRRAVITHLETVRLAMPLLRRRSLVVEVTEGDSLFHGGMSSFGTLVKSLQKIAAYVLAAELRKKQIAVIAATPGFLRSETMLEHFKVTEGTWQQGGRLDKHFLESETPLFLGRGIAALASDPDVLTQSGTLTSSWALARRYGVADREGRRPDWGAHLPAVAREYEWVRRDFSAESSWLRAIADRLDGCLAAAKPAGGSTRTGRARGSSPR